VICIGCLVFSDNVIFTFRYYNINKWVKTFCQEIITNENIHIINSHVNKKESLVDINENNWPAGVFFSMACDAAGNVTSQIEGRVKIFYHCEESFDRLGINSAAKAGECVNV